MDWGTVISVGRENKKMSQMPGPLPKYMGWRTRLSTLQRIRSLAQWIVKIRAPEFPLRIGQIKEDMTMIDDIRGSKHTCSECETKYYDQNRPKACCPRCGSESVKLKQLPRGATHKSSQARHVRPVPLNRRKDNRAGPDISSVHRTNLPHRCDAQTLFPAGLSEKQFSGSDP